MKINRFILSCHFQACMISALMLYSAASCADDDFQQWMQQQSSAVQSKKTEFQEYKDKRDKAFTAFLKAQWKAVDILRGEVGDQTPKPDVLPVAKPEPQPQDKPESPPVPVKITLPEVEPRPAPKPVVAVMPPSSKGEQVSVDFFGRPIRFVYDAKLRQRLSRPIDKNAISAYWSVLSRADYEDLLTQLDDQKSRLLLNDWAYASLVNKLASKINTGRRNETALLSWFILTKSGYRARIAYNDSEMYLLVPSQQEMFEVSYFTFNGTRFYAVSFDNKKQKPGRVYTYDGEYPESVKAFDMRVTPAVAADERSERRHLSFMFEGKKYNIDVSYDQGRIQFFDSYPQLKLDLYFESGVYDATATPLQKQLAHDMQGMSEQQAVNFLLRFVQTALQYETDEQQFGEENYLFPEETLFYPYSDCEDRAVLFAWLVRSLLKLDVVGLDYPGHVATAVHFNENVKGDGVTYKGERYVVSDPTYINARAGMSMPQFKQYKPTVIAY